MECPTRGACIDHDETLYQRPWTERRTRVLCSASVERRYELENMRRSLAMLTPGVRALTREEALTLVEELAAVQAQLDRLRDGLRRLIADE